MKEVDIYFKAILIDYYQKYEIDIVHLFPL